MYILYFNRFNTKPHFKIDFRLFVLTRYENKNLNFSESLNESPIFLSLHTIKQVNKVTNQNSQNKHFVPFAMPPSLTTVYFDVHCTLSGFSKKILIRTNGVYSQILGYMPTEQFSWKSTERAERIMLVLSLLLVCLVALSFWVLVFLFLQ